MSNIYNLTDTWNAAGVTFTAIKMNVTDTASAAGSRLIDLQMAGSSRLYLDKSGALFVSGPITASSLSLSSALALSSGGTGATTAAGARASILPALATNGGKVLAVNAGATDVEWITLTGGGSVSSVNAAGGSTGLTFSGGPITGSGTLTLGGVLALASGGTGAITATAARVNLLPSYSTNAGKVLSVNALGTDVEWSVPATGASAGANTDITSLGGITGGISSPDFIQFDTTAVVTPAAGRLYFNDGEGGLSYVLKGGNVVQEVGQSQQVLVYNGTGATISKGQVVYSNGAQGQRPTVALALATADSTSARTLGIAAENIANGAEGWVTTLGIVENINTSAFTAGAQLYLSGTVAGGLTSTKPVAPIHMVYVARCIKSHASAGRMFVTVQNGYEMDELHDVSAVSPANNDGLFYNTATSLWEKKSIVTALGYTPYNATNPAGYTTNTGTVTGVTGTAPIASSGGTAPVISISAATTSAAGSMSAADKTKLDGIAAGATANIGTVTSVAITVPTGLTVSGTPITASGTLSISLASGYSIPTTTNQANWDTAYTDRLKWDGGSTGLTAATGRTSLGATTVGSNLFTLTNPSAIRFLRINADNTVSALDAATFRTAIGAGTSSTTGTVTSVSGTANQLSVATGSTTPVISLTNTAVTAGTYANTNLTVDAQGRITSASSGRNLINDEGSITRVTYPIGAQLSVGTASVIGAIKITLPTSWTDTMMSMRVRIYDYSGGESFEVNCGGYNYNPSTSWINTFAYIVGQANINRNFTVRFGHDGTNCCIVIGEIDSTWSYPKIVVEDFMAGHSNFAKANWDDGWSISTITTLPTITSTISNIQVGRVGSVWYDSDNSAYYVDPASTSNIVGLTVANTITGNITGSASSITGTYGGTLTSSQITTGLGFTPYNATNPAGYTSNTGTVTSVAMTVPTGLTVSGTPINTSGTLAVTLASGYSIPTTASQTNWDTAYADRNKWDGGATGLTASTGRTSLGATTVGSNLFTLANPSAIRFLRVNADNTVSALDAAAFRTAIGAGTGTGTGTVTSVSVASANGFAGTVATASTTPAITISTSITGLLKGNGTAISAATAGTDYVVPSGSITGSAATLTTARTLTIGSTGKTFNGSANVSWSLTEIGAAATSHTHVITDITDATRWWNNFGDAHATRTSFDTGTMSVGFGWRYVQGPTNGPGVNGATQYYSLYTGLGNQFPATGASSYGMQIAFPRNVTTPYITIRYNENNVVGAWQKISAGYADTAGSLQTARTINGVNFNGTANITVTANTTNTLTRGTYLTGNNFNGSAATTWAVDATNANTASKVVARDASGNFSAGTITAALSGNATTATTLQNTRTINGTNFNGSANITTASWGTARTLTIGSSGKSVDGSANVSWSLAEIGAQAAGNYVTTDTTQTVTGTKTFTGPINLYNRLIASFNEYQYAWGGSQDLQWKRVAILSSTATDGWRAASGQVIVYDEQGNHGNSIRTEHRARFTVVFSQNGTPLDTASISGSPGFGSVIRLQKIGVRNYEVQVRQPSDWRLMGATLQIDYSGGDTTVITTDQLPPNGAVGISTVSEGVLTENFNISGNAATATALQTARNINGVSFDGTANITVTDGTKLPLAGGTMTGAITFAAGQTWPTFNQSTTGSAGSITGFNNPTTAATANTIVYRDASGDDFRRYGFAQYFNMSHGVSGATTDTIFYSSGDNYIRKNNATGFRASLNVPTRTGGDASGTWGINITGNSATVGTLSVHTGTNSEANKIVRTDANGYIIAGYINSAAGNEGNNSNPPRVWGTNGSDSYLRTYLTSALSVAYAANAGLASIPRFPDDSVDKDNITTRTETGFYQSSTGTLAEGWPTNSGGWHHLISSTHSNDANYYALQISSRFDTQELYFRNTNGSGTTAWSTLLHSGNYNSYAPTLTGTGASGSWGINVTGNAATATALQTARTINGVSFNGTANITVADSTKLPLAGGTMTGLLTGLSSASTDVNTANDSGSFSVRGSSTTVASMSFHRTGAYAINMGLGTDNVFRIGGWSASNNCLQVSGGGIVTALTEMRAPIFRDSDNTSYYIDPANSGTAVTVNGQINIRSRLSFAHDDVNGNITNNTGHTLLYSPASKDYIFHVGGTARMNLNSSGNLIVSGDITAFGSPSDINLKDNIENIPNALAKVRTLNGITFNYKKDGSRSTGVIAQEVEKVLPEVIYEATNTEGTESFKAVRYGNMVGLLIEAIKEQQAQIDELKDMLKRALGE